MSGTLSGDLVPVGQTPVLTPCGEPPNRWPDAASLSCLARTRHALHLNDAEIRLSRLRAENSPCRRVQYLKIRCVCGAHSEIPQVVLCDPVH